MDSGATSHMVAKEENIPNLKNAETRVLQEIVEHSPIQNVSILMAARSMNQTPLYEIFLYGHNIA